MCTSKDKHMEIFKHFTEKKVAKHTVQELVQVSAHSINYKNCPCCSKDVLDECTQV